MWKAFVLQINTQDSTFILRECALTIVAATCVTVKLRTQSMCIEGRGGLL
jgi:hypothetical protein